MQDRRPLHQVLTRSCARNRLHDASMFSANDIRRSFQCQVQVHDKTFVNLLQLPRQLSSNNFHDVMGERVTSEIAAARP